MLTNLLIKVPRKHEFTFNHTEQLIDNLHQLFIKERNGTFTLEIAAINQKIGFHVICDKRLEGQIKQQIYTIFPNAEVVEQEADIEGPTDQMHFSSISLKRSHIFPIKLFESFDRDPIQGISSVFSSLDSEDSAIFSITLKPIYKGILFKMIERGRKNLFWGLNLRKLILSKDEKKHIEGLMAEKHTKEYFLCTMRFFVKGKDRTRCKQIEKNFQTFLHQFSERKVNDLHVKKLPQSASVKKQFFSRSIDKEALLLNQHEVCTLYHLPAKDVSFPNIREILSKKVEPPENLPIGIQPDINYFAETTYRNKHIQFGLKEVDRRRHLYIVGKSGTGKTKMMELLIKTDATNGKGFCIIDPHGDFAETALKYIPDSRINDVIYFNAADKEHPVAFNLLSNVPEDRKQIVVKGIINIFKKLFADLWEPQVEHILRYSLLALLDYENPTIGDISKLLTDNSFRREVTKQIKEDAVKTFWTTEFVTWKEKYASSAVLPLNNKINEFVLHPIIESIVCQPENKINFDDILNNQKILIVNLAKGKIGEENTALLGSMIITKLQETALARARIPEDERKDFYLYVDEFQNFATDSFTEILSESRKFRLNLILAHQYITQLSDKIKDAIFGNIGSLISFRVGAQDADILEKEFEPEFSKEDLINLDVRNICVKLSIDGRTTTAFSGINQFVPEIPDDQIKKVIEASRKNFSKTGSTKKEEESKDDGFSFPTPVVQ